MKAALDGFLAEAFPKFNRVRVSQRWAGIMDCTPDSRPIIGRDPYVPGCWVIAGFGGHGMPCGVGAGRSLAEAIVADSVPKVLDNYRPERFRLERYNMVKTNN